MKLTNIRAIGRYINPETNRAVNVKNGRRAGRSVDVKFYLHMGKRIFISDCNWNKWKEVR